MHWFLLLSVYFWDMSLLLTEINIFVEKLAWFCNVIASMSETFGILCCGVHIFINICNGFNCFLSYPCIIADCFIAESKNNEMPKAFCRVRSAFWHNYGHDLDYGHGLHHKLTCLSTCAPTIYHIHDIDSVLAVLPYTEKYFHCFGDFTYWIWIFQLQGYVWDFHD